MTKNKATLFLLLCSTILSLGCKKNKNPPPFSNLIGAKIDMKISADSYFLKSFGIASKPLTIMNDSYWKLEDNQRAYFYVEGYLRNDGDSVMILPINYELKKEAPKVYKLFDFSLSHQKSWKLLFKFYSKDGYGASVTFLNKSIVKGNTIYNFSLTPFFYHETINDYDYSNRPTFNIAVSKSNGIVTISTSDPINSSIIYEAIIYPKQKFLNNMGDKLEL